MAFDGYNDQTLPRQARAAELLDAETEAALAARGAIIATRLRCTDW